MDGSQDQHSAFEASVHDSSRATSGYGQTIRCCSCPLGAVNETGVDFGSVPFSTHSRSWEKSSYGFPPGPPTQCPNPGTGKY